jgi:MYXO-CTERM domain-containing protein
MWALFCGGIGAIVALREGPQRYSGEAMPMKNRALFFASVVSLLVAGSASAAEVNVATTSELTTAIAAATAGDVIVLADGTYRISSKVSCSKIGTEAAPIVVKAANPLLAKIEFDTVEGFAVTGAYWTFEGLDIGGVCAADSDCEHAFHVSGAAHGFTMKNSRVHDFNAQLKVNASEIDSTFVMPHKGLIEGNELFDSRARNTSNPTTKLNIDTGDDWIVRANIIRDFHKGAGDNISYGAFMKSGGKRGTFERNLVMCSRDTTGGVRIGLSFGGGGTGPQFCAPAFDPSVPCSVEHEGGVIRNNIIVNCSDVGIYLNKSKDTKVLHNTLIATNGVDFRFETSSGEARANVLTSKIRIRDGGMFTGSDNLMDIPMAEFTAMYLDPLKGDLRKKGELAQLIDKATATSVTDDYCARARTDSPDLGALEHSLGDCVTTKPVTTGTTPMPGDAGVEDSGVGSTDSGAGSVDSGVGSADSGAGSADSGAASSDAGTNPSGPPASGDGGCACRTSQKGADHDVALFAFAAAVLLWRRRSFGRSS